MCEVLRDNFEYYFPVIEKAIRRSDFVDCRKPVTGRQQAIDCDVCGLWQHRTCGKTGISKYIYGKVRHGEMTLEFICESCKRQHTAKSLPENAATVDDREKEMDIDSLAYGAPPFDEREGIDTEFTGLTIGEQTKRSLFDTGEERYKKLRKCVSQITVNQLGLAAFIKDPKDNRYEVQTFNLFLFPTTFGPVDVCFMVQASSWEFQCKHNMDFNKMMYHGVPFMNEEQHNLVKDHISSHAMNSGQLSVIDEYAAQKICSQVAAWVISDKEKDKYIVKTEDIQGIKDFFVLSKEIRNRFPLVWTSTDESGNIIVEKVTVETRQKLEQESADAQQEEEQKLLESMLGFTRVFRVLTECKKPLVGHNMLLDLLLLYDKFYKPLPVSYRQFKAELNSMLPTILDTKHITNTLQKPMVETGLLDSTTLEDLYIMFKSPKGREHVLHSPDIFQAEGSDRYKSKHVPHEAGYDSYLCGYVFLRLAHILTFQEAKSSEVVPCTFRRYLQSLVPYTNRINVIRASLSHICLDDPDPPSRRPELLYVKSRHFTKPLNIIQLANWFSPYGSVDIRLENKTRALVAAGNFRCAKDILAAFKGHDTVYVTKYSIWRHSLVVRSLLWFLHFEDGHESKENDPHSRTILFVIGEQEEAAVKEAIDEDAQYTVEDIPIITGINWTYPSANIINPHLPSYNALADLGLWSLLALISGINNIDPDLPAQYAVDEIPYVLSYKSDPTANCIDPDLPLHNVPADLDLCSLLGVISRTNNIDPDLLVHYVMADQGLCC